MMLIFYRGLMMKNHKIQAKHIKSRKGSSGYSQRIHQFICMKSSAENFFFTKKSRKWRNARNRKAGN